MSCRMNWITLIWLIYFTCLFCQNDAVLHVFAKCKRISTGTHNKWDLDCRNLDLKHIPREVADLTVKRIYLSGNPYVCNCAMAWFLDALHRKYLNVNIADLDQITCAMPEKLKGSVVKNIGKKDVCSKGLPCQGLRCSKYAKCIKDSNHVDKCVCRAGYKGNGVVCKDLNECSLGTHGCDDVREDCINTIGSFECHCKPGLEINNESRCDVPEPCDMLFDPCPDAIGEVCSNVKRGYKCICKEGFEKNSEHSNCSDVNECEAKNSCSKEALCINKIGSYQCICKAGFSGNGKECEDIDECETGDHGCPSNAVCINSEGSYKCVCNAQYHKFGHLCVKEEKKQKSMIIYYGGAGAVVFLMFTICCCCCCCCRQRKTKKSKDQLINDQEMQANQDLLNLALETDPFLLQQQQVEQQMYLLGMQQPQDQYMPYFDASAMQGKKGVQPNESSMTTWSDDEEDIYAQDYAYDCATYE